MTKNFIIISITVIAVLSSCKAKKTKVTETVIKETKTMTNDTITTPSGLKYIKKKA